MRNDHKANREACKEACKEALTGAHGAARRRFIKESSALLASGLAIGFQLPAASAKGSNASGNASGDPRPQPGEFEPNAWVRVLPDDTIKLVVHKHDSGTGTRTALAAVVAEELDVDPFRVEVITPENPFYGDYIHPLWKVFSTGGSTSVALEYDRLRRAGATARAMLIAAAAAQWKVAPSACSTQDGAVIDKASGRRANYGSLARIAAQLPAPKEVTLKDPAQFRYIGKLQKKRGAAQKARGTFPYSIDVSLPGMLVAVVSRAPVIDARVRSADAKAALAVPGVRQVVQIPGRPDVLGGNQAGVAVLADDYWSAHKGQAALKVEWEDSPLETFDSSTLAVRQAAWLDDPVARVVPTIQTGDPKTAWPRDARVIEASYSMPYKAQNALEPINVTAWAKDGSIEYWGGLQVPSTVQEAAEVIGGIPAERVSLHELVSGGSFGSRESKYWLFEVTWLTLKTGKPVKLMNSREDEMRALFYHSASYHRAKAAFDASGNLITLQLRAVMPASAEQWEPGYFDRPDRMDYSTTEAISKYEFAYDAPHVDLGWVRHETGVPTGWYRAVSYIPNVFAVESFMDEAAHAAQRDPVDFRLAHMKDPRHAAVLREAAARAGWGQPLPDGTALGVATNQAYSSYIAVVARVRRNDKGVVVEKLTCVADCGLAVSPGGVEEQLCGGLMWGLGHATADRIDIRHGRVEQKNFDTYRVMRMSDMPEIDIHIVQGDPAKPGGVGELSSPSVAPAVSNAVFRLTGRRLRDTPFGLEAVA
ncbi:xanthine dehydrogenase family protein molybdopterin-binding subunit [Paraburkholderia susongensis]|uniref:Isoquinoline 1-oxidoreductase, beta subunit n=1 Tax=Paraburkholderia susongensis TaxID=1515439 RepID=A0A1X7L8I5_9BURK|nr:molybdopterin cofactor-binding domain-containing protein [Paraburkholderia susongensis]SMG50156.1 isoquinoline 1-oxidoreductase, beta subunit [Paraburkholderia susongensis]